LNDLHIEFLRLSHVPLPDLCALLNHPGVVRFMPLAGGGMDAQACREWVVTKDAQWDLHGYGPWGIMSEGRFVGWGGFQCENGDADLALVLHPSVWGKGKAIFEAMLRWAWNKKGFASITILLPRSRTHLKGIARLGFVPDGEAVFDGIVFKRFRLFSPTASLER